MTAFVQQRNPAMDRRFAAAAVEYMRHGEALGVRWDYAFFQMLLETGNLSFTRGNGQPGNVRPSQNNFAGLGAAGRGKRGEHFPDVSSGVRAHLEHLLLYAGEHIENPVAERTRKVQQWGILTDWRRRLGQPVTFGNLSQKWAPSDRRYPSKVDSIAQSFFENACNKPDPQPELVAEARRGRSGTQAVAASTPGTDSTGTRLARRAVEEARAQGATRSNLGAASIAKQSADGSADSRTSAISGAWQSPSGGPATDSPGRLQTASAGTAAAAAAAAAKSSTEESKCRVWTASYGGQKAVIIRAATDGLVNYTVLDVNEGSERREMEAYIAAYAKGGETIGEFGNKMSALDRAFELCPEG